MITLFSEFEMDLRLERQLIGVQKAKENGVKFGRKPIDNTVIQNVKKLFLEGLSVGQISLKLALGKSTIYRLLK
jgi:DNA invertase Pin-like site-specific DNA recombinase